MGSNIDSTIDIRLLGDFWLGFWKEAYRVQIWFNPFPSVQNDVAIRRSESSPMLLGRLTADIVSIAAGGVTFNTAGLLFMAGPAECIAGALAAGLGEFVTCPGAALQMAGAAILAEQAVVSSSIAVNDANTIIAMLSSRRGGRKSDLREVDEVADEFNMSKQERRDFGSYIEDAKAHGYRGTKNSRGDFTMNELRELAHEFLNMDY